MGDGDVQEIEMVRETEIVRETEVVAGCPSYNIFVLMGECWFFLIDQHSPIIKKIDPQNLGIFK